MSDNQSSNNRIAKNSIFMAIRMVFVLGITFYTTRIVLNVLGVEDYGIYNVVCGFVLMFSFLTTSMSNGIQRFYNYELGKNGVEGANRVYNMALLIQLILAIIVLILTESLGEWYLHNKMVIPDEKLVLAEWIFQFSILNFLFIIAQAPFTAAVMAHERMDFFAVVSIADVILKLIIVFAIPYLPGAKLILYGGLLTLISMLDFTVYYIYCKNKFPEIAVRRTFDKDLFKSMIGFSGWNIFGSLANVMKEQGINLVLNLFFGPVVNAARGIAQQINGGLQSFVSNITTPVRPQVIQSYAKGEFVRTMNLTFSVSKLSCCFLYLCSLPVMLEIDFILNVWLGDTIPSHTGSFVVLVVLTAFINNLNSAVSGVIHASGKMMKYQTITSIIAIMCIPFSYIGLKNGYAPEFALAMVFIWTAIAQVAALIILKCVIRYSIKDYMIQVLTPLFVVVFVTVWPPLLLRILMPESIFRFLLVTIVSIIIAPLGSYFIVLNKAEKELINSFLNKVLNHKLL